MSRSLAFAFAVCSTLAAFAVNLSSPAWPSAQSQEAILARTPFADPGLPLFADDGGSILLDHMRLGQGTPQIDIAWIDRRGRVTLRRGVRPGGDVQSVYAPSSGQLWMLIARPHLPLNLTSPRHYVFASLDPSGEIRVAAAGKTPWLAQNRSATSFGGEWMPGGVFWTYNTFELLRPLGLNWVDMRGAYHPPDGLALPFGGPLV